MDGYFGLLYLYLVIMASIHAAMLGAAIISKEERDKTAEFLFVKPISRATIISAKLGASIVIVVIFNLVTLLSSIVFVDFFNAGKLGHVRYCTINGWNVHDAASLFVPLGSRCGICEKAKVVYPDINGHLVDHIYYVCWHRFEKNLEGLKYVTPFKYYEAKNLLHDGGFEGKFVALSLLLMAAFILTTYVFYRKRDLHI